MTCEDWDSLFKSDSFTTQYKGDKVTGQFALSLIDQSNIIADSRLNSNQPLVVLDNTCGTGDVSHIIYHELDDTAKGAWSLTCGDISLGLIENTRRRAEEEQWSNVAFEVVDSQQMSLPTAHFTHVFTSFEACQVLQPGGILAFSTWIGPGWVNIVGNAAKTMCGDWPWPTPKAFLEMTQKGEWNSVAWIESQLYQRNLLNIKVRAVQKSISSKVPDFLAVTALILPMVSQHFWSEKQREKTGEFRRALETYITDTYGREGDIPMNWVAILSTACKPNLTS
ncbi:Acetylaranotin bis-thiomethyltransferase [Penicillium taxi]|uniref:Acetylaranotin bis-thiomethyltransferase n=1 Tax=Penicillium taxi TaxID=168475 RepID=UPI0025459B19|nr:Acetylaranotin bis-thiomethyltransferase [Penicillium taxi]KAJ5901981.1 Acetylaranotin bis-thiomethyltransferase [Penicillium taxi]